MPQMPQMPQLPQIQQAVNMNANNNLMEMNLKLQIIRVVFFHLVN